MSLLRFEKSKLRNVTKHLYNLCSSFENTLTEITPILTSPKDVRIIGRIPPQQEQRPEAARRGTSAA
jgi:hypothetical protein